MQLGISGGSGQLVTRLEQGGILREVGCGDENLCLGWGAATASGASLKLVSCDDAAAKGWSSSGSSGSSGGPSGHSGGSGGVTVSAECFPAFSPACCAAIAVAQSLPAIGKANEQLFAVVGEAEEAAFSACRNSFTPCTIDTHDAKNISALCCAADAEKGWTLPGPAAAVRAVVAAGKTVSGGGTVWWVNVNQTLKTGAAPFVNRLAIRHQYVNWFPTACNNATAIGMFQNMMCHSESILECRTSANPYIT